MPLTGPSGNTVLVPVAPGVPRVRKGLPDGAVLQLTPQEERDVVIEYKCVRAMPAMHAPCNARLGACVRCSQRR